jgi:ribonucleotide reductase beta subunit family protein with ferritin-like domain
MPSSNRFVLYPIKNEEIWAFYKKAEASFWMAKEIDLQGNIANWTTLSSDKRFFISHVLAFFAASNGIVVENLAQNFMSKVQLPEARAFYGFQIAIKNIHSKNLLPFDQHPLQRTVQEDPSIQRP